MAENSNLCELEKRFPRILEHIAQLWNKFELDAYLNELMIDTRGDRHGFPEEAAAEILFLRSLHDYRMGPHESSPNKNTVWADPLYTKSVGKDGVD